MYYEGTVEEQDKKKIENQSRQLKIHCVGILKIFIIYFKMSKLIVISILWMHNKKTTQKNLAENLNSSFNHLIWKKKDYNGLDK